MKRIHFALFISCVLISVSAAVGSTQGPDNALGNYNEPPSRLRGAIEKFGEDFGSLNRFYSAQTSPNRAARLRQLYDDELALLKRVDFNSLNHDEQVDYILFANYLNHENDELKRYEAQQQEMSAIVPFARVISDLEDARRRTEKIDSAKTAVILNDLAKGISENQKALDVGTAAKPKRTVAYRAAKTIISLRQTLGNWYKFYNAYDPLFTWWNAEPYKAADDALQRYLGFVNQKLVGIAPDDNTTSSVIRSVAKLCSANCSTR